MSWHAFEIVGEPYERMRGLLFRPFGRSFYLKLALVALIISGLNLNQGAHYDYGSGEGAGFDSMTAYVILVVILIVSLVFAVISGIVSAIFEFVFLDAVISKNVEITGGFSKNFLPGIRLFAFRAVLMIALTVVFGVVFGVAYALGFGSLDFTVKIALTLLAAAALFPVIAFFAVAMVFTRDFVVPIMRSKKVGILSGWGELLSSMKNNKAQFGVYLVAKTILSGIAWIVELLALAAVLTVFVVVFGAPLAAVAILLYLTGFGFSSLSSLGALLLPAIVVGVLLFFAVALAFAYVLSAVTLPISVFFRYYSLLFLDRIAPEHGVLGGAASAKPTDERGV